MHFTGGVQRIRCIDWFENDLGFTTCEQQGLIQFYDLYPENGQVGGRLQDIEVNKKDVKFTSVVNIPGRPYEALAVGNEYKFTYCHMEVKNASKAQDPDAIISQIVITPSGKSVIAGVGEEGKPGSIQVWIRSDDKALERSNKEDIQAHSKPIDRIRLTDDC